MEHDWNIIYMSGVNRELLQKKIIISLYYEYVYVFQDTFVKIILFLNYFNKATNMNSAITRVVFLIVTIIYQQNIITN